jgi:hypothetical protein
MEGYKPMKKKKPLITIKVGSIYKQRGPWQKGELYEAIDYFYTNDGMPCAKFKNLTNESWNKNGYVEWLVPTDEWQLASFITARLVEVNYVKSPLYKAINQ